jgi:hypothetical protein
LNKAENSELNATVLMEVAHGENDSHPTAGSHAVELV